MAGVAKPYLCSTTTIIEVIPCHAGIDQTKGGPSIVSVCRARASLVENCWSLVLKGRVRVGRRKAGAAKGESHRVYVPDGKSYCYAVRQSLPESERVLIGGRMSTVYSISTSVVGAVSGSEVARAIGSLYRALKREHGGWWSSRMYYVRMSARRSCCATTVNTCCNRTSMEGRLWPDFMGCLGSRQETVA